MRWWQVRGKYLEISCGIPPKENTVRCCVHPSSESSSLWSQSTSLVYNEWFFFLSAEVKRKISIVTPREETGYAADIKVSVSSVLVFCFVCYFFSPGSPCLLRLADLQVIMAAFYTHTVWLSLVATLEKFQYLGFSSSYLKFPLVCEMGTFSLTDQQQ